MGYVYKNLTPDEVTQLEFQAGNLAARKFDEITGGKLDIQQDAEDNGKIVQVGADGKLVLMDSADGITIDDTLSVANSAADAKAVGDALALKFDAADIDATLAESGKAADAKATGDAVAAITNDLDFVTDKMTYHESTNHLDLTKTGIGAVDTDGTINESASTKRHSDYIPVTPGIKVRMMYVKNGTNTAVNQFRYAFYNASKEFISGTESDVSNATAPANTAFVRVSTFDSYFAYDIAVTFDTTAASYVYEDYYDPYTSYSEDFLTDKSENIVKDLALEDTPFAATAATFSGTDVLRVAAPHAKRNYTISFRAKIGTFDKIIIGIGKGSDYLGGWIEIDETNIKVYTQESTSEVLEGTYAHGLTFSETVSVDIRSTGINTCEIVLSTVGGLFKTQSDWFGCYGFSYTNNFQGKVTVETDGGSFTDCVLSYYCADYKHELWAFGDSYFDHWCAVAVANGYGCFAIDGASGRHSTEAWHSLELETAKRMPKKILWCMGLNDFDTDDDTAESPTANAYWVSNYNKLKAFCASHGIELILATIPCVPSRNNCGKNAIIRESGYRYVDIADAVGGSEPGSTWYTGLLSSDDTHPSTLGDKVIAARFMADVPELMGE